MTAQGNKLSIVHKIVMDESNHEGNINVSNIVFPYEYGIYECKDGYCKPTHAIFKFNDNVYYNNGDARNNLISNPGIFVTKECNNENIGMILNNYSGICYMDGTILKFGENSAVKEIEGIAVNSPFHLAIDKDGHGDEKEVIKYGIKSVGDFIINVQYGGEKK